MRTAYDFTVTTIDGASQPLKEFAGRALPVVNVASQCGLTPQYAGLQALRERYRARGFAVLGFPCDQFGSQEPGTEPQIKTFCETRYGVAFPMFATLEVSDVQWNVARFLVGEDGAVVARFSPTEAPESAETASSIERVR